MSPTDGEKTLSPFYTYTLFCVLLTGHFFAMCNNTIYLVVLLIAKCNFFHLIRCNLSPTEDRDNNNNNNITQPSHLSRGERERWIKKKTNIINEYMTMTPICCSCWVHWICKSWHNKRRKLRVLYTVQVKERRSALDGWCVVDRKPVSSSSSRKEGDCGKARMTWLTD